MASAEHPVHWLHYAGQRLGLVPTLGGGVAAWQLDPAPGGAAAAPLDLWRPWAGSTDRYTLASFPLVPWSNRISAGGFDHGGTHHPVAPNRAGEPYPIHGDGWLQPWRIRHATPGTVEMTLDSSQFDANPYSYHALQRFVLLDGGMDQTLTVTHTGPTPLPYGLGQHPCFVRTPLTRLSAPVQGVWLSGADPLPLGHTTHFPPGWDPRHALDVNGSLIDNAYTGWAGHARITRPEQALELTLRVPDIAARGANDGYCLLYRPPAGPGFCFEPITHPIDAFHAPGQPGLQTLRTGERLTLQVEWRFKPLE